MKLSNTLFLGSLAALLFSQPTVANEVNANAELSVLLKASLTAIAQPDIAVMVSSQLTKAELELRTHQLIVRANNKLDTAPVKVELGE